MTLPGNLLKKLLFNYMQVTLTHSQSTLLILKWGRPPVPPYSQPEFSALSPKECEYHMRLEEGHRLGMFIKHTN